MTITGGPKKLPTSLREILDAQPTTSRPCSTGLSIPTLTGTALGATAYAILPGLTAGIGSAVRAAEMEAQRENYEAQMQQFADRVAEITKSMREAFTPTLNEVAQIIQRFWDLFPNLKDFANLEYRIRRAAIERYGIAESDIKRVEGSAVRLWNHRRIEIEL